MGWMDCTAALLTPASHKHRPWAHSLIWWPDLPNPRIPVPKNTSSPGVLAPQSRRPPQWSGGGRLRVPIFGLFEVAAARNQWLLGKSHVRLVSLLPPPEGQLRALHCGEPGHGLTESSGAKLLRESSIRPELLPATDTASCTSRWHVAWLGWVTGASGTGARQIHGMPVTSPLRCNTDSPSSPELWYLARWHTHTMLITKAATARHPLGARPCLWETRGQGAEGRRPSPREANRDQTRYKTVQPRDMLLHRCDAPLPRRTGLRSSRRLPPTFFRLFLSLAHCLCWPRRFWLGQTPGMCRLVFLFLAPLSTCPFRQSMCLADNGSSGPHSPQLLPAHRP